MRAERPTGFRRDFNIIALELSRVLRQFHWWHRAFWDLRFVLQNLYIRKQVRRFWQSWGRFQNRCVKGSGDPNPSYPTCYDPTVTSVSTAGYHRHPPSPPRRKKKNITKRTFRAATIVVQVKKNDYYFCPLNFKVEYFFFCGLLSLKHDTLVQWYRRNTHRSMEN